MKGLGHENDWGALPIADEDYDDAATARYAIQFLESVSKRGAGPEAAPFFLACGFLRPHLPWYVPQAFVDSISLDEVHLPQVPENDLDDVPDAGRQFAAARRKDFETIQRAGKPTTPSSSFGPTMVGTSVRNAIGTKRRYRRRPPESHWSSRLRGFNPASVISR
ncbi:MAG: hypothetical protein AAGD07_10920 [Planctomycetota bacterium]